MVVKKINLKAYPKFWTDFVGRINTQIDPSAHVSGQDVKRLMQDWYGINVHIMQSGSLGEVYMLGQDYTAFLLRWG